MLRNYLLITLRSMMKNKVYLFINITGMAIAIACCITAWYNYDFNASFDSNHVRANEIYRVNMVRDFQGKSTEFGLVPLPLGEVVRQNRPDVAAATRYSETYADFRVIDEVFASGIAYVDPEFFTMFSFAMIHGTVESLREKGNLIISDELALKLFNSLDVIGNSVTHILQGVELKEYVVSGVFKQPPTNSSFNDPAYSFYENYWEASPVLDQGRSWYYRNTLFVQVSDPSRVSAIEEQLKPFTENNNKVREDFILSGFKLDPFVGMAVRDTFSERPGAYTRDAAPQAAVIGCSVMGILVLLIACFNLTNTSIAISSRRLKEIGLRKVMGSMRSQLIVQFIGETTAVCFLALLLGMGLAEWLLIPAFNSLWPYMKLETNYFGNPDFLFVMIGILSFTALLAGSYPAFYISKFEATTILKGKVRFGGTNPFSRVLLTLQFAISLIGIVCSFAFTENARFQKAFDLGFSQEEALFTWVGNEQEYQALYHVMAQHPDVTSLAGSEHHISSSLFNDPIKHDGVEVEVDILNVGDNYLTTAGLTLTQGRDFVRDSETDRKESVIITENLAAQFGWDDPIGKEITWLDTAKLYVVGVVKNIYSQGLWRELQPTMLRYIGPDKYRHLLVSAPADKIVGVNEYLESKWKEVFPYRKFASRYMSFSFAEAANVNSNIVKMFIFLGIVAVLLSITGLFTLVSLNIIRRMKEIGVRKVLGASVANIAAVINTEFAIILLLSCLLGSMAGYWLSEMLMRSIWRFYQPATTAVLVVSSVILLLVSALTVSGKTFLTARMNPVNVLRDE